MLLMRTLDSNENYVASNAFWWLFFEHENDSIFHLTELLAKQINFPDIHTDGTSRKARRAVKDKSPK